MATAYTNLLGFALPVTGELNGTWGDTVNNSITSLVESSIAGSATASVTSADWTLTTTGSGAANQARAAILIPTGTPGVSRNIIAPSSSKAYIVDNQSNAAVVLKGAATAGVTIATNTAALVAWDGADFVAVSLDLANATGTLPVTKGGTGAITLTGVVKGTGTSALTAGTVSLTTEVTGTLPATNGGTGQSSYAVGDIVFASTTTALSKLADVATGNALISGGVGVAPAYGKIGLTTHVTGTLPVANGGTGTTTLTANNVLLGNGTSALQVVAPGTSGNVLTSNGTTWTSSASSASLLGDTDSATPFETSLGYQAGNVNTGTQNTFIGYQAGLSNTTGTTNTATGYEALFSNTAGVNNTVYGARALRSITTGNSNNAVGTEALRDVTVANNNVAVGESALRSVTGASNIGLGFYAGQSGTNNLTTGTNNIVIGVNAQASAATVNNEITIGNSSNTVVRYPHSYSTVSALPSAATVGRGARTFVTDALTPAFQATVAGGGAVFTPVYSDGTNWKVG